MGRIFVRGSMDICKFQDEAAPIVHKYVSRGGSEAAVLQELNRLLDASWATTGEEEEWE